jgi:DNA polymerase I-like protein with 3'-5' exonuclease and polymerase domains
MDNNQKSLFNTSSPDEPGSTHPVVSAREVMIEAELQYRYITKTEDVGEAVAKLAQGEKPLGMDTEIARLPEYLQNSRAGLDPYLSRIRLLQLYGGGETVYIFDMFAIDPAALAPLMGQPMVAHNAVFDIKHLHRAGIPPHKAGCTMLMANALSGRLTSLAHLTRTLLGFDISKAQQMSNWQSTGLSREQLEYAAVDAYLVFKLQRLLKPLLVRHKTVRCYTLMRDIQQAVALMELNGVHFDFKAHRILMEQWERQREEARQELSRQLGPHISPDSGKQVSDWLKHHLEPEVLTAWPRTKTGQLRINGFTLNQHAGHPLVSPLLAYKDAAKLLSTFGANYVEHRNPETGRIHSNFRIGGTSTGRMSCYSPNIQNPPRDKKFRALFTAPPGRALVVADYGQIELRVAALLSGDENMLKAYARGEDLHTKTAAAVAGVPTQSVTKEQRQAAKAVNFGMLYGQGHRGLASYARASYGVDMTLDEARKAQEAFFNTYPGIRRWQQHTAQQAKHYNRVTTPGGRVRDFRRESGGYRYTEALNTPIQGGAAEVLMAALARLEESFSGLDAKFVNMVHDEIVLEVAESEAEAAKTALVSAMTDGFLAIFPGATTVNLVEVMSGRNWAEAK